MSRLVLIVAAVLLVIVALGVAWLGLLPPEPRSQRIERPVPIDRPGPTGPASPLLPSAPAR